MIFDALARILLSPLLIAQGIGVRRRALVLPEASGPRAGTIGDGAPLRVLIVGDSSAAGVGAATQSEALAGQLTNALSRHHRLHWQLRAKTGATTASTLAALRADPPERADVIVMALGVNDVTRFLPRRYWLRKQRDLHRWLREHTGARMIYVCGLPPMGRFPLLPHPLRWLLGRTSDQFDSAMQRALLDDPRATHMPLVFKLDEAHMAPDGFHPGPEIYAEWGTKMASRIASDWPEILHQTSGAAPK